MPRFFSDGGKVGIGIALFLILALGWCDGSMGGEAGAVRFDGSAAQKEEYAPHSLLVKYKGPMEEALSRVRTLLPNVTVVKRFKALSQVRGGAFFLLRSKVMKAEDMLKALVKDPNVEAVSLNYKRHLLQTYPNDPYFDELWGLNNTGQTGGKVDADIDAPEAWDTFTGSTNVVVAVIDTGVDYTHEDLAANMWVNEAEKNGTPGVDDDGNGFVDDVYGYDFAGDDYGNNDPDPMDIHGHGTHVSGTIAAVGNNAKGVVGVNWRARIMALKMFRPSLAGYDSDAIEAIDYAVMMKKDYGVNIVAINASWGGYGYDALLKDAIKGAGEVGIVFVAAAGNDDNDNDVNPEYPASYDLPNVVAVAATNDDDNLAWFSNYGFLSVDLAAPGVSILSTLPGGGYQPQEGDIFYDDMESGGDNWVHGGTNDSWQITTEEAHSPLHGWSDSPYSDYQNDTHSYLMVARDIDLSGYANEDVRLGFWIHYDLESGYDRLYVELSKDGGTTWEAAASFTGSNSGLELFAYPVPPEFRTSGFRFRFRLSTDYSVTKDGVYIDDVGVGMGTGSNNYEAWSGTSMATPHVTGAVALMAGAYPGENTCQRLGRLLSGVDEVGSLEGKIWSSGRLNLHNSITRSGLMITLVSPNDGLTPGTSFTLSGCNFGDLEGRVVFTTGSVKTQAQVTSWSQDSISALVPSGAGKFLRVIRNDGQKSNIVKVSAWVLKHPASVSRSGAAAAVYGGKIYLFGGFTSGDRGRTGAAEVYDPTDDSWKGLSYMPTPRALLTAASVGGKIYLIGGYDDSGGQALDTVEAYNPSSDSWTTGTPLPVALSYARAVVLNGKIYVVGGRNSSGRAVSTLYVYNPDTGAWSQKASMTQARYGHGAVALNGRIYVFGGYDGGSYLSSAEVYDPGTDSWSPLSPLPLALARMGAATDGIRVYLAGGTNGGWSSSYLPAYIVYDPATDTYAYEANSLEDLITAKSSAPLAFVSQEGALYSLGGLGRGENSLNEVERLLIAPSSPLRLSWVKLKVKGPSYDAKYKVAGKVLVDNQGGSSFFGGVLKVYLSQDRDLDPSDTLLVSESINKIKAYSTKKVGFTVSSPLPTDETTLYFIAVVETDSVDSSLAVREFSGGVDLSGKWTSVVVKGPGAGGNYKLKGKFYVENRGNMGSPGFHVQVYYSADAVLDGGDVPLCDPPKTVGKLKGGDKKEMKVKHTFSSDPAGGYLILQVDSDGAVPEVDETNNQAVYPVTGN